MKRMITMWLIATCCLLQATAQETVEESLTIDNYIERVTNYLEAKELEKALSCYDILLKSDSDNAKLNYEKSYLLSLDNRYEEALHYALKARTACPDSVFYLHWSWDCYDELAKYDQLQSEIDSLMLLKGESASLLLLKAQVMNAQKNYAQSAEICKKVLSIPEASTADYLLAYDILFRTGTLSPNQVNTAIDEMLAVAGSDNYDAMEIAVTACNSVSNDKQAEKYKTKIYALREQYAIKKQVFKVDEYHHSDKLIKVYQYFNPTDAGSMPVYYLFDVFGFNNVKYRYQYRIRVEQVQDFKRGPQKAVMATLSDDGFRTYWDTYSVVKKTSYSQWKAFAAKIIDGALKVGSAFIY